MDDGAQMMADLGVKRRDMVSAPDENRNRKSLYEEAAILRGEEERKRKVMQAKGGVGGDRVSQLKKWNTQTTFEVDEVSESLENRYNGQGHRADLASKMQTYRGHEDYQQNGASERPNMNHRGRQVLGDRTGRPESQVNDYGRAVPPRDPNRQRAPSPRRAGTTRFLHGRRVDTARMPTVNRTVPSPSPRLPTRLPPLCPTATAAGPSQPVSFTRPGRENTATAVASKSVSHSSAATAAAAARTRAVDAPTPAPLAALQSAAPSSSTAAVNNSLQARLQATNVAAQAPPTPAPAPSLATVMEQDGFARAKTNAMVARAHVEEPDSIPRDYYVKFPTREAYLPEARRVIAKEVVECAADPDGRETKSYLAAHKECRWLYDAAIKARSPEGLTDDTADPMRRETLREIIKATEDTINKEGGRPVPHFELVQKKDTAVCAQPEPAQKEDAQPKSVQKDETTISSPATSGSSVVTSSTDIYVPSPACDHNRGTLATTYYAFDGKLVGNKLCPVEAPVYATMSVTT